MASNDPTFLRFFIVAEQNQQRLAFSDTIRSWNFDVVDCVAASQLMPKHFEQKADIWLVDTEDDYAIIQKVEQTLNLDNQKTVLIGFMPAPYINESLLYAKWQRQLKRKISHTFNRPELIQRPKSTDDLLRPWRYVVLLGASMGGPLAVKEFLDHLPADLPVSLLLAQHFNQDMLNTLPRILNRHNAWRCEVITNTQQLLQGRCLILPIHQKIVCDSNGRVILQKQAWQGTYNPPISQVMLNCSEAFGSRLITIIFSGMGNDGSDNAMTAKTNGSLIWAQSPESSTCASQPEHMIASNQVTYIGSPQQLAKALVQLCYQPSNPPKMAQLPVKN